MELSSRLFYCPLCNAQCIICSPCDNGQIYCSQDCSRTARKKSCNEGEKRYQQTPKGKLNHALRQKRYRERQCKIVTDHTCQTSSECDPHLSIENKTDESLLSLPEKGIFCCCCGKSVPNWIRHDFLKQTMHSRPSILPVSNRPP